MLWKFFNSSIFTLAADPDGGEEAEDAEGAEQDRRRQVPRQEEAAHRPAGGGDADTEQPAPAPQVPAVPAGEGEEAAAETARRARAQEQVPPRQLRRHDARIVGWRHTARELGLLELRRAVVGRFGAAFRLFGRGGDVRFRTATPCGRKVGKQKLPREQHVETFVKQHCKLN